LTVQHARFVHRFRGPLSRVWQATADTARYNEAAGFPLHEITEVPQADGSRLFRGKAKVGPFTLVWQDVPCNWVRDRWLLHTRLIENGPIARLTAHFTIVPDGEGCTGTYDLEVEPRGLLGRILAGPMVLKKGGAAFLRLAAEADAWALGQRELPFDVPAPSLPDGARNRAERIATELVAADHPADLVERLVQLVCEGPENEVTRLRPLALARRWSALAEQLIPLCLEATRRGLLSLRWDLLCPRCRGAKVRVASLDELPRGAHCPTCAVDYDREFSKNVEATFHPAPAIRQLHQGEFCLLGPMSTPHILAHLTVGPTQALEVSIDLPPGPYRVRTLEPGPEFLLEAGAAPLPIVRHDGTALTRSGEAPALTFLNATEKPLTFVLEERAWVKDVLTADRLTALQSFRDLFSDQVLRPGDEVAIERVAILFSDLRGSTALYERLGDAAAYHRVREHFGYLARIVREHDGAVVKTIGDAVMAVFADPTWGVAAAFAMQQQIGELNAGSKAPLVLKLGLHAGPCIAVNLNDRLDYFGRTVNLAARLQGESRGGDVVLSAEMAEEPEVAAILATRILEHGKTRLRGFGESISLVCVTDQVG
jgi:class 3 adenylate cyclase